ncbi:MAG: hypothetical protein IPM99_17645 [Rubrivivax sp.]|nr:hypothetical protein [Rubrivivax sp.]
MRPVRVHRYHTPVKDQIIAADSPRWRSEREADLRWRWLEMADSGQSRWVVVLTDPARHLRLDLFAWKKKYGPDEARALLRGAAASLQTTAALAQHFERVAGVEQRVGAPTGAGCSAEHERTWTTWVCHACAPMNPWWVPRSQPCWSAPPVRSPWRA